MRALQQLPDVELMIIGRKSNFAAELAQTLGVQERLWQTDFVPDDQVEVFLACANVMCLPLTDVSINRGRLPNKLLDYLAAGQAVVASPVGDVRDIVERYRVGLLASTEAEFADSLNRLLTDADLNAACRTQARRTAETVFAWERLGESVETFYHKILALGKRRIG